jgi:hypothetical protein
MPVTTKQTRVLREKFGETAANEIVEVLNDVESNGLAELRALNEANYARFDAKIELRFAEIDRRFAAFDAKIDLRFAENGAKMADRFLTHTRWMVGAWMTVFLAIIGLWFRK